MHTNGFKITKISMCEINVSVFDESSTVRVKLDNESMERIGKMFIKTTGWKYDAGTKSLLQKNTTFSKNSRHSISKGRKDDDDFRPRINSMNLSDLKGELKEKGIEIPDDYKSLDKKSKFSYLRTLLLSTYVKSR